MMDECVTRILLGMFGTAAVCFWIVRALDMRNARTIHDEFTKLHQQVDQILHRKDEGR